ncbi:ATP-binding protein [Lysinibacillus xylanilyticus]|uniref:ATP-binding protein n=1 Tax=Lysinibacillus xylanilyticus TaxID=582475 RepID=UPI0038155594
MKPVNLHSILEASQSLPQNEYKQYLSFYGINPKSSELDALTKIIPQLEHERVVDFNHFYFGFQIEQISSEFDLIRIGKDKTINIEFKKEASEEVVINQMRRCRYYLNVLDSELLTYTFLSDQNSLYKFTSDEEFVQVEVEELASELISQQVDIAVDINNLFEPSRYLVSPFNSTKKFLEGQYFLTNPQEQKKQEFFGLIKKPENKFIGVKGEAGTGKTLLTYDIAKELQSAGYKVLLIFCAELNLGHHKLINKGWHIKSIKKFDSFYSTLNDYDFIFIDEAQRIYTEQFDAIVDRVRNSPIMCIFSYDPVQCFSDYEFRREIPKRIETECNAHLLALSKRIRANKELSAFVNNLFYLRNGNSNSNITYSNINVIYFSNNINAKKAIRQFISKDWEVINYTPSRYKRVSYEAYQYRYNENIHNNIGQEFDYVLGVIDHNFYYNTDSRLISRRVAGSPGYDLDKMLYQILTRARKKITLIIINNHDVFTKCMKILGHP